LRCQATAFGRNNAAEGFFIQLEAYFDSHHTRAWPGFWLQNRLAKSVDGFYL
jgi:hypothetical protein